MTAEARRPGDILFEARHVGGVVRVAAIDPASGTEAVVVGPASAGPRPLQELALRKLAFLLRKQDGAR